MEKLEKDTFRLLENRFVSRTVQVLKLFLAYVKLFKTINKNKDFAL